jgi:hypothetical protein
MCVFAQMRAARNTAHLRPKAVDPPVKAGEEDGSKDGSNGSNPKDGPDGKGKKKSWGKSIDKAKMAAEAERLAMTANGNSDPSSNSNSSMSNGNKKANGFDSSGLSMAMIVHAKNASNAAKTMLHDVQNPTGRPVNGTMHRKLSSGLPTKMQYGFQPNSGGKFVASANGLEGSNGY